MMFSKYIDKEKRPSIMQILNDFEKWCEGQDGTKISKKKREELENLFQNNPELVIICDAMQDIGYDSF